MEIEEKIIQHLLSGPMHVNKLAKGFGNKGTLTKKYKKMVEKGTLEQHKEGNKIILSLGQPKPYLTFEQVMSSLPLAEQRADKILKRLKETKPLFIRSEFKDGEKLPMNVNPKCKKNLNKILVIINDLVSRSIALTYAQCLDSFPKKSEGIVSSYHKNCIKIIRKIMDKLENQHKESDLELGCYLYYGVNGYSHLTNLLFMAKNQ